MPLQEALAAAEQDSAAAVGVRFGEREGGGLFAAVDERGRLAETGWQAFPTLMCAALGSSDATTRLGVRARWQDELDVLAPVHSLVAKQFHFVALIRQPCSLCRSMMAVQVKRGLATLW